MGFLVKLRNYRERKAYERSVKMREKYAPYGVMYGKMVAYQRLSTPTVRTNGHSKPVNAHDEMKHAHDEMKHAHDEMKHAHDEMKHNAKMAFMTHPGATDEDFERCWPAIRDEIFKSHTLRKLETLGRLEESGNNSH